MTIAYVLLDPSDLTARIGLAGHPPPVLIAGTPRLLENVGGLPLGMLDAAYAEQRITLTPGARLVLYSDGVLEAQSRNGEEYGFAGIERHFADPGASSQSLLDDVRRFASGAPLEDDATVVTIEVRSATA